MDNQQTLSVSDSGSRKTLAATMNDTACLLMFASALFGSHSISRLKSLTSYYNLGRLCRICARYLFRVETGTPPTEFRRRHWRIYAIRWAERPIFIPSCFLAHYGIESPDSQFSRSTPPVDSGKLST